MGRPLGVWPSKAESRGVEKPLDGLLGLISESNSHRSSDMFDIQHDNMYRNVVYSLRNQRKKLFITLTCNIDGAALHTSSEQSMWTFTACINELRRSIRFNLENMIGE